MKIDFYHWERRNRRESNVCWTKKLTQLEGYSVYLSPDNFWVLEHYNGGASVDPITGLSSDSKDCACFKTPEAAKAYADKLVEPRIADLLLTDFDLWLEGLS